MPFEEFDDTKNDITTTASDHEKFAQYVAEFGPERARGYIDAVMQMENEIYTILSSGGQNKVYRAMKRYRSHKYNVFKEILLNFDNQHPTSGIADTRVAPE